MCLALSFIAAVLDALDAAFVDDFKGDLDTTVRLAAGPASSLLICLGRFLPV